MVFEITKLSQMLALHGGPRHGVRFLLRAEFLFQPRAIDADLRERVARVGDLRSQTLCLGVRSDGIALRVLAAGTLTRMVGHELGTSDGEPDGRGTSPRGEETNHYCGSVHDVRVYTARGPCPAFVRE